MPCVTKVKKWILLSIDGNAVLSYSCKQPVVALGSDEAELNASVVASAEALFVQIIFNEMHVKVSICVYLDSSAATAHLSKLSRERLQHIQNQSQYLQHLTASKAIEIRKLDELFECARNSYKSQDGSHVTSSIVIEPHSSRSVVVVLYGTKRRISRRCN